MAGFGTHVTTSTVLGIGYGAAAFTQFGFPPETCLLATSLCAASGMLPDLDSDSGRPLREMLTFTASVVPMLLMHRFQAWGWSLDTMALAGVSIYLGIRYLVGAALKRLTVHRGMFHSIPACLIAGELAFLLCESDTLQLRYLKAGAVMVGFMSHLILDEIWSIEMVRGRLHLKSSSGTAMKLWGENAVPNLFTYGAVAVLTMMALNDPLWMKNSMQQWSGAGDAQHIAGREPQSNPK